MQVSWLEIRREIQLSLSELDDFHMRSVSTTYQEKSTMGSLAYRNFLLMLYKRKHRKGRIKQSVEADFTLNMARG